ncbi:MAG: YbdK family carboxylate-amine ligase [Desulforhopalus sp.]
METGNRMVPGQKVAFAKSSGYTLGVEIEFQTLDRATWDLAPLAPVLLEHAPSILRPRLSPEFIQSILEIQTNVCFSLADVENDLMQTISLTEELAAGNNCMLFSASLHPYARYRDQLMTTNDRYARIIEELQIVGRRFISQGFHVHVGMPDEETAIRVCNKVQAYLPLLLSLSTSSPYSQGEDTGLMSYRTKLFEALPLAGIYSHIPNWNAFLELVAGLQRYQVINSVRDLWWDARPSPEFGTLEIRVCDLPTRFSDILALTAVMQSLVATLAEDEKECSPLNPYVLQSNKWQAARHGLRGSYVDPSGMLAEERISSYEAVRSLLKLIEPMSIRLGSERYVALIHRILKDGTGADFLRRRYLETGRLQDVVQSLQGEFWP